MSNSIFPFIDSSQINVETKNKKPPKEYDWDFERNEFLLENGKFRVVTGVDAIKIWIRKLMRTPRYRYTAYSWDYGHELDTYIGSTFSQDDMKVRVKSDILEALMINPYIISLTNFKFDFVKDRLSIEFTAITDFGEVSIVA